MNSVHSILLFLLLCIPLRILIAIGSYKFINKYVLTFYLFAVALGMFYLYFTKGRMGAPEAGGVTWWAGYRWFIGLLYLIAGIISIIDRQYTWIPLTIDILFGLIIFTNRHLKLF